MHLVKLVVIVLALMAVASVEAATFSNTPVSSAASQSKEGAQTIKVAENRTQPQSQNASLTQELKSAQECLAQKKQELAKLHRKYVAKKGRTPSADELKEYEKKRAAGSVSVDDNPYVNKSRLTVIAPSRKAYYDKLEEVQKYEERVRALETELSALPLKATAVY